MIDNFDFDISQIEKDLKNIEVDFAIYKEKYVEVDICGLVQKVKSKKRTFFNIYNEVKQLDALIKNPPGINKCYKLLSVGGGFSSISIIQYIAELESIEDLYVSTFRVGNKHFDILCNLKDKGLLKNCYLITSATQERVDAKRVYNGKEFNYYSYIKAKCDEYNWQFKHFDNHSKLLLLKTPQNYYVVETSSNLNENPKIEQFNWENDKVLFEWYKKLFKELLK